MLVIGLAKPDRAIEIPPDRVRGVGWPSNRRDSLELSEGLARLPKKSAEKILQNSPRLSIGIGGRAPLLVRIADSGRTACEVR